MKHHVDLSNLFSKLPPIISRDHVEKLLGGVVSSKTLANLDSLGEGPKRMRVGRKVAYLTEDLLEWLSSRSVHLN
jgi:predicted DNA-binding transcriptional regulator AlpA